jgi:integrase
MFQFLKSTRANSSRSIHAEPDLEDLEIWEQEGGRIFPRLLNKIKSKFRSEPQATREADEHRIRRIHKRVCKLAGVKSIRIHDLRHTYASHYIMNGGSLAELQGLLGHSSPNMTMKYAHLAPGFLESKASVVSFSHSGENVIPISRRA